MKWIQGRKQKYLTGLLLGFASVSAIAAGAKSAMPWSAGMSDRTLGNVVAVEREIDTVYQSCVDQVKLDPAHPASFFFCKFEATKNKAEFSVGQQFLLELNKEGCNAEATVENSMLLITFGVEGGRSNNLEGAKACLRKALDASETKDHMKFIIYSVR